ncbi:hypothetical protein LOC67_14410 [Stieleria sp. JC731]|uniref:hypothetical protein n=1 Tax=Pirellulaceae TaxID=2691357 RepID=UPI001E47E94F|nr:hypothetical protein [Stieleria sp. JC731]MCC9601749.1 hypothetical protein [Stieleria sp. JC731]
MSTSSQTTTKTASASSNGQSKVQDVTHRVAEQAVEYGQGAAEHYVKEPARDLFSLAKSYAKDHPDVAACWAFGLGIIVGWKIKP